MSVRSRARGLSRRLFHRAAVERELDDELRDYIERLAEEKVRAGMGPAAAHRAARLEMGGMQQVRERVRDSRTGATLESIARDVRLAARALRRTPLFTTVAILTLALGLGANTAIFSVIDAALLRPLPGVRNPGQLVAFERVQPTDVFDNFGYPDYRDFRDRTHTLSAVAAYSSSTLNFGTGTAERIRGTLVTGNYFGTLGVHAALGRVIQPADDGAPGAAPVAVLSDDFWRHAFGGDRRIIGGTILLDGYPYTVIGIAPRGFRGTTTGLATQVWVPMSMEPLAMPSMSRGALDERAWGWIVIFGRLKPRVSMMRAEADMRGVARQLELAYPQTNKGRTVALVRGLGMFPDDRAEIQGMLTLLLGAVSLLLLIACTNVAGLLLVRASVRQREMAARLALGAGRLRLVRQLLTEGALLASMAGALGLAMAFMVARFATAVLPTSPVLQQIDVSLDGRVLAFTLAATVLTGVVLSVVPALRVSHVDPMTVLKEGTPASGRRRSLAQRLLVITQVATSVVLLISASVVLSTLHRLLTSDPGFATRDVAFASVDLVSQGYSEAHGRSFLSEALRRLDATRGVRAATVAQRVPPDDARSRVAIFHPGEEPPQAELRGRFFELGLHVGLNQVAPGYLHTVGIPLTRGRDFTAQDGPNAPAVVIINEALAQRFWPGEDPIGKLLSEPSLVGPPNAPLRVIGVAANHRAGSLALQPALLMYEPLWQRYDGRATIIVASSDPGSAVGIIRRTVAALDPTLPIFAAQTMRQHLAQELWEQRAVANWIGAFGVLAVVLAGLGLYGVVAQSVTQRMRELSIRLALGAEPSRIASFVVRDGMRLAAAGFVLGIPGAIVATRAVRASVIGSTAASPLWMVAGVAVLAVVILVACYLPARRAARANPVDALRCE
ncbi:MAG TPA: ABC transporter permease [Gemmatimonadaceae bacterium]|nr:ABC transporter permease [Gemmatimonadaceae bacterium]